MVFNFISLLFLLEKAKRILEGLFRVDQEKCLCTFVVTFCRLFSVFQIGLWAGPTKETRFQMLNQMMMDGVVKIV